VTHDLDITTVGLALLALVVALYALAASEQKTPYITTSIFETVLLVLSAIISSMLANVLAKTTFPHWASDALSYLSVALLLAAVLQVFYNVMQARNRKLHFRDDNIFKNLKVIRAVRVVWRAVFPAKRYQFNPIPFPQDLVDCIVKSETMPSDFQAELDASEKVKRSWAVAYHVGSLNKVDDILIKLSTCFLAHKCWMQYATCTRHPIEFLMKLKSAYGETKEPAWADVADRIVAVDAYTPHFGFTDSVHDEATKSVKELGVHWVAAKASFASLHSAAARAFNKIKKLEGGDARPPALVIYDGPSALVDLESPEQYRIFLRHVIASERLWGGMFTVIIECGLDERNLALLRGYSNDFIDLTGVGRANAEQTIHRESPLTKSTGTNE
jgi:hypothetical protein